MDELIQQNKEIEKKSVSFENIYEETKLADSTVKHLFLIDSSLVFVYNELDSVGVCLKDSLTFFKSKIISNDDGKKDEAAFFMKDKLPNLKLSLNRFFDLTYEIRCKMGIKATYVSYFYSKKDKHESWEEFNFGVKVPIAGVLTNLSMIQSDILNEQLNISNGLKDFSVRKKK